MDYREVSLPPGTVIGVRYGAIEHVGIVTDWRIDGMPAVISNSYAHRGVREESLEDFARGRAFRVHKRLSDMPGEEVADRARRMVGRRYDVLRFNCEHFDPCRPRPEAEEPAGLWRPGAGGRCARGLAAGALTGLFVARQFAPYRPLARLILSPAGHGQGMTTHG